MRTYYVAKTPTSGFIGRMSIDDIVARLKANEISGDFVAAEDNGPAYADMVKRTDIQWELVSKLVSKPSSPESVASPAAEEQTFSDVSSKYRSAYLQAKATATIGEAFRIIGIGLGLLIVIAAVAIGGQSSNEAQIIIGGVILGIIIGIPIFILGVLVSAQAQILKATLDTAVHSSPFLTKEDMAKVMSS